MIIDKSQCVTGGNKTRGGKSSAANISIFHIKQHFSLQINTSSLNFAAYCKNRKLICYRPPAVERSVLASALMIFCTSRF